MGDGGQVGGALALVGEAGHQQDADVWKIARRRQRQRNAVHDRHLDVGQQQVEFAALAAEDLQRLGAVLRGDGLVAVHGDGARHQRAHGIFVVGNQDSRHRVSSIPRRLKSLSRCWLVFWSMILSKNRFALFRIMLYAPPAATSRRLKKRMSMLRPSAGGEARRDLNSTRSPGCSTACSSTL